MEATITFKNGEIEIMTNRKDSFDAYSNKGK